MFFLAGTDSFLLGVFQSIKRNRRSIVTIGMLIFLSFPFSLFSQQSSILPKNIADIEREREQEKKERQRIASSSIISITQTRFQYRFGRIEGKGMVESVNRYDRSGNRVEEVTYNTVDGSIQLRKTNRYDTRGNLIEENLLKDDEVFKTVHRYTAANNRTETIHYKSDGSIDKKISYIYDDHGHLLESIGYLNDGRLFLRESIVYDTRGNIAEIKNSQNTFSYTYDPRNNIRTTGKYTRVFSVADSIRYVLSDYYEFTHDRSDNLLRMIHYRPDSTLRSRIDYTYDRDGKLMEEKEYSADQRPVYQRKILRDKNGNIIEENGNDRGRKFRTSYKYDSRGNITELIEYDQVNEPKYAIKYSYGRSGGSRTQPSPERTQRIDSLLAGPAQQINAEEFEELVGGKLVAPDGAFLGLISADTSDSQSIINSWGQYGFSDSPTSIFNPAIPYGGKDGIFSPFNPSSPSPPSIYKDGKFYVYLTENINFRPRTSPRQLIVFLRMLSVN